MARGWESKHVESQQEARGAPLDAGPREPDALDACRALELTLADLRARLGRVSHGPQRQMLERALADVEARLRAEEGGQGPGARWHVDTGS